MAQVQGMPELIVTLGRRRLGAAETSAVTSVTVASTLAAPAQCIVSWRADDSRQGRVDPEPGDALRIELGGHREPLFVGEVTVVERSYGADLSREVRVRAYDGLHRLRKRQFTRLHDEGDLADLARTLVEGTGLGVVGGARRLGPTYQVARSDLDLLVDASARVGLYPVAHAGALRLVGLEGEDEEIELVLGMGLHSVELEVSQEPAFRSAEASGWWPDEAAGLAGSATRTVARPSVRADAMPSLGGGGGPLIRSNEPATTEDQLAALAQAELDVRSAGEVTASLVTDGDPRLRAGRRVRLVGVPSALEGAYTVCGAVHTIDGRGYETAVSTRPPDFAPVRLADQLTLGIVTDVDDPQQRGRVRVELPALAPLITAWAPVVVAGAGADKGAILLPGPGDTVLVALVAADPANAIVLGGLYGTRDLPDAKEDGARGERYTVTTADGQRVTLNGAAHSIRITDGHGSVVELGPDLLRISAATDLLLEAPGRAMRIRAKTVDFEEAS